MSLLRIEVVAELDHYISPLLFVKKVLSRTSCIVP